MNKDLNIFEKMKKYEKTHPNLIQFWKNYIFIKEKRLEKSIEECEIMLTNIRNISDLDIKIIIIIYLCKNYLNIAL